jgi:cobalt-precorrin-6B (C15)-methyltransferase
MSKWQFATPGIPDDYFLRGEVPMTKEEVRAITISKLRLNRDSIVCDIGAGTGSLTIEAGLVAKKGEVWAVEKNSEGVELIKENKDSFGLDNVKVISGEAPTVLVDLPALDRVIIGGSGGNLAEILEIVDQKLVANGRIVINAITLETLLEAKEGLKDLDYDLDIVTVNIARTEEVGSYHMLKGQNPVYIISGERSK